MGLLGLSLILLITASAGLEWGYNKVGETSNKMLASDIFRRTEINKNQTRRDIVKLL